MKSAYELAMERLEQEAPSSRLTEEQKREIAEIDSTYRARIAERELFLKEAIAKSLAAGQVEEAESQQKQLSVEVRRFQEECEAKKAKIHAAASQV